MPEERLQKILAHAGVASRRKAEALITSGRVSVNGKTVSELGSKADLAIDKVKVDGRLLSEPKHHIYIALNKPKNCVSTVHDPQGRQTVKLHPSNEKPIGEWNQYEITLDGGNLELKVNGLVQNTATDMQVIPGYILLQAEGAEIEFRKVELKRL